MRKLPVGDWAEHAVSWLTKHGEPFFHAVNTVVGGFTGHLETALQAPPVIVFALVVAVIGLWLRGALFALLSFVGMMLIDNLGEWDSAMSTLAQVLVASIAALVIGIPVGILAARSPRFAAVVRPVLDFMQTMPAFVYLLPAVFFFGIGQVPGIIATMIFSLPPGVRLTQLGISQVDREMVEAADAFGTPPARTLLRVQLPLALGTIMAGVNQVIMLSLSMVVISGMVGAQGLGTEVFGAITQLDIAGGVDAGLAVVILAITLDRLTGALGERLSPVARRKQAGVHASGWETVLHYRPRPVFALSGLVVLVLLATGLGIAGSGGDGGKSKNITIGYIPWDEDVAISNLWKYQLEKKGYKVRLEQVDAGPLYAGLANKNVDLFLDSWLPATHADYYNKYKDKLENLGPWYDNASMQLAVLKNDPANSVQDLANDPGRYKGRIVGIEPSAGEMKIVKNKVMPQYGLDGKFNLVQSSTPAMLAELTRASNSNTPIVVTLWKPHWAYSKFPIKPLADPKVAFGNAEKSYMLARKGFGGDSPEVAGWLKKFKMTDQQLFPLEDLVMNKYKGREQEGVKEWVKSNQGFVDKMTS
ncbi:ABC transporter permease/substrate binding protein [Actinomadura rupiterrae]|uniref:ABC transporter permease/substrate binding protein n=1 Tax=Actinomadura rupiterrae TaxID=559627 RepID=UPI0020A36846|nr:ABC transporter permease/substrate binding protein [Actinomadura rupiterrae]MCP2337750.1 glycine betaine/proline transport system substrate-binding protein [Actinomadura rupiterrae]